MNVQKGRVQSMGPCVQKPVQCPGMLGRMPEMETMYVDQAGVVEVRQRLGLHRSACAQDSPGLLDLSLKILVPVLVPLLPLQSSQRLSHGQCPKPVSSPLSLQPHGHYPGPDIIISFSMVDMVPPDSDVSPSDLFFSRHSGIVQKEQAHTSRDSLQSLRPNPWLLRKILPSLVPVDLSSCLWALSPSPDRVPAAGPFSSPRRCLLPSCQSGRLLLSRLHDLISPPCLPSCPPSDCRLRVPP